MDQNQPQLTFDESVKQVMQTLPAPIRHYLAQGTYSVVAKNLATKYGLQPEQGSVLEREIMLLLMGVENPEEFVQSLAGEANLDGEVINAISRDVNAQIFVPLSEQLKSAPPVATTPPPVMPQPRITAPTYAPPAPTRQPIAAPQPPRQPTPMPPPPQARQWSTEMPPLGSSIIQANPSLPQRPGQAASFIRRTPLPPKPPVPPRPFIAHPPAQKPMTESNRMLEDHEEPSPSLGQVVRSVTQPIVFKPPVVRTAPTPPSANLRSTTGSPNLNILRRPIINNTPPPIPLTPKPPLQSYSSDPYHEPIDENRQDI